MLLPFNLLRETDALLVSKIFDEDECSFIIIMTPHAFFAESIPFII